MSNFKERAKNSFFKREYKKSLMHFSLALKDKPDDKEAKIGAMLADMAFENEEEAIALFEFYEISMANDDIKANDVMEDIIESVDDSNDLIKSLFNDVELNFVAMENGIEYKYFRYLVEDRGDFKRALEDVMFSTKIVIHKKEDFIEFLNLLIENEFTSMAMNYLDTALMLFPKEKFFQTKLNDLKKAINS
jgi:tetratricopeptide (TPR) repeat protein